MNKTISRRIWIWFIVIILHIIYSTRHNEEFIGSSSSDRQLIIDDTKQLTVYKPTNSASNVALCVMVKNETLYLDEWVDFHYALGFSPIIIYDNSDDFDLMYGLHPLDEYAYRSWYESREDIHEHLRLIHYPTLNEKFLHIIYHKCNVSNKMRPILLLYLCLMLTSFWVRNIVVVYFCM
jgi:hypothetical protein